MSSRGHGEVNLDLCRPRADAVGRGDQLCEAAPRHKWRSEGWSTQARGGVESGACTSTAPWVRGGPWAWARSPEACVRGTESILCGAMRCEHQELMAVKVGALHNLRHLFEDVVTGRRPGRMEARNSASAPCSMAPRRALGHGGTMCTQPIAGGSTRAGRAHFLL